MDTKKMIDALNKAVALEHTAVMQYKQHALLVSGLWRKEYEGFFSDQSESAHGHAHKFGQKVVVLGGIPTVELGAPIRQSTDLEEMLNQDLELERAALQAYMDAHAWPTIICRCASCWRTRLRLSRKTLKGSKCISAWYKRPGLSAR